MIENWKEIVGYEGLYEVSDIGNVRSLPKSHNNRFFPPKLMAQHISTNGYLRVSLNHPEHKKKSKEVHILVAIAWVPNPNNYKVVNHLKGNKLDNRAIMMEWTTHSGNTQHAYDTGLKKKGSEFYNARIVLNVQNGFFYLTVDEAAETYSINRSTLYNKLCGNRPNNTNLILT